MKVMKIYMNFVGLIAVSITILAMFADAAFAQDKKPILDTGDTAWMLTSTTIVLLMTIPGVALFYAGMVRKKKCPGNAHAEFCHCLSYLYCLDGCRV